MHAGGKLVIINLQATPKDKKASLVIHGRADEVMQAVMRNLPLPIPAYVRQDSVTIAHCQEQPSSKGYPFSLRISSVHGEQCPMPLVQSVNISFPVNFLIHTHTCLEIPIAQLTGHAYCGNLFFDDIQKTVTKFT